MTDKISLEPQRLALLCDVLIAKKVRRYCGTLDGSPVTIDFAAAEPERLKETDPLDPEQCRCGHPAHQHNMGLCLGGCSPDKCLDPADAQKS